MNGYPLIRGRLEAELQWVEDRLRALGQERLISAGRLHERGSSADRSDHALVSRGTGIASDTRARLLERRDGLLEALRRIHDGTFGRCQDCLGPISERRLLFVPEATRCVRCQGRWERTPERS